MMLTVLVMALITPLTVKSTRSMLQMQRLQPEMKRLQDKYKDDREKLNQTHGVQSREQINPLGGCLPLLAQMPVFIIMYQLLRASPCDRVVWVRVRARSWRRPSSASRPRRGSSRTSCSRRCT